MSKTSPTKAEKNRINGKKGGRPKGAKSAVTLEREKVAEAVRQQIMLRAGDLVRAAMVPAMGVKFVYRIDKKLNKKGDVVYEKNVLVTDPNEIETALNLIGAWDNGKEGNEYYFVTTERPDHRAVQMLFDRALGKSKESLEISNPDGNLKTIIINKSVKK